MRKSGLVLERKAEKPAERSTCQHYWLIEPALGPTSNGVCKYCGQKKVFLNIVDDSQPKESLSRFFDREDSEEEEQEEKDQNYDVDEGVY